MTATVPMIMESLWFFATKRRKRLVQACEPELAAHGITARHVGMPRTIAEQDRRSLKKAPDLHRIDRTTMVTLTDEFRRPQGSFIDTRGNARALAETC